MAILDEIGKKVGSLFSKDFNKTGSLFKKEKKTCVKCGEAKEQSEFYVARRKSAKYKERFNNECKECERANRRQHYRDNKDRILDYHRKNNYGMSKDEYKEMLLHQDGACAICKKQNRKKKKKGKEKLSVDHCHHTGEIRGLLCRKCNTGLGQFNDDIKLLKLAIKYLEKADDTQVHD